MATVTHPPETNDGVVTSWLPLPTAWPSVQPCSTDIYSESGGGGLARAFDPFYGKSIDTQLTCLPPAATLWWSQSTGQTVTSLGPLACPELYTTGTTSVVNSLSTFVACCPSNYGFQVVSSPGSVGQCISPLTVGQHFTYLSSNTAISAWVSATTSITASGGNVFGVQLNGYIFAPTSTAPPTGAATTTSNSTIGSTPTRSGISGGAGAGVALGVLALVGLCGLAVFIFLKLRQYRRKSADAGGFSTYTNGAPAPYSALEVGSWRDRPATVTSHHGPYEMGVSSKGMS